MQLRKVLDVCRGVAQLAERGFHGPKAAGSTPVPATNLRVCKAGAAPVVRQLKFETGELRTATFLGRTHLVVPVVALVEGVVRPANSSGPELVLASEFGHVPEAWNGRPVMVGHPKKDGSFVSAGAPDVLERAVGKLFNTRVTDRKLHTEAWIDEARALELGGDEEKLVTRLKEKAKVEVSVGVFMDLEEKSGDHEGTHYDGIWRNVNQDHLAMLRENEVGACSIEMGCGAPREAQGFRKFLARVASALRPSNVLDEIERAEYDSLLSTLSTLGLFRPAITDDDLRQALSIALRDAEPNFWNVIAVDDQKTVIYHALADGGGIRMYARSFKKKGDGKIALGDDKQEVRSETSFVSVNSGTSLTAAGGCRCGHTPAASAASTVGATAMTKAERIAALISSKKNGWTEAGKAVLESMTEEQLKAMADAEASMAEPAAATAAGGAAAPAATTTPTTAAAPAEMTEEQALAKFPRLASAVNAEEARVKVTKDGLVTKLKAATSAYTEDQLKAMSVDELQRLATALQVETPAPDFSGRSVGRAAEGEGDVYRNPPDSYAAALAKRNPTATAAAAK